jgi:hypothetical protein
LPPGSKVGQAALVASYAQRYIAGDHEGVWTDLRRLGPVPEALIEDCAAVAALTVVLSHRALLSPQILHRALDCGAHEAPNAVKRRQ